MGGCGLTNPSFSRIFGFFFNLTRPLTQSAIIRSDLMLGRDADGLIGQS